MGPLLRCRGQSTTGMEGSRCNCGQRPGGCPNGRYWGVDVFTELAVVSSFSIWALLWYTSWIKTIVSNLKKSLFYLKYIYFCTQKGILLPMVIMIEKLTWHLQHIILVKHRLEDRLLMLAFISNILNCSIRISTCWFPTAEKCIPARSTA